MISSERRGMPTLRELREFYTFNDLTAFHATLDALEDAEATQRAKAEAMRKQPRR